MIKDLSFQIKFRLDNTGESMFKGIQDVKFHAIPGKQLNILDNTGESMFKGIQDVKFHAIPGKQLNIQCQHNFVLPLAFHLRLPRWRL
jgi:hypothetical protein